MGSDLQLTGLASGFDWAPVVEQLIELERIPQKRLEREKQDNEEKMSDLSLLKSQLDTLNGAGKALQNEDLYKARKVGMDSDSAKVLSARADAGALTGTYTVSIYSLSTQTEMNSKNRAPSGLGKTLDLSTALKDLPLQTPITEGTFTISGKTFSIDNLSASLQDVMDMINAQMGGADGVNPEGDGTGITFEYDFNNDRMVVDGGEYSVSALGNLPILGSPTDTSNFLEVLRLLNRETTNRAADWETGSGVSIWGAGDVATNPHLKSWVHTSDSYEIANNAITSDDDRIYVGFDHDGDGKETLFRRIQNEAEFNAASTYNVADKVYRNGYIYEAQVASPTSAWTNTMGDESGTTEVTHNGRNWRLMMDLETLRAETGATDTSNFKNAVDTDDFFAPITSNANAILQGDIVKGDDGVFFRATRDRTEGAENFKASALSGSSFVALKNTNASLAWNSNINGSGNGKFRPDFVYEDGRLYQANEAANFAFDNGFVEHSGPNGQVKYLLNDYVFGKNATDYGGGTEYDEKAFQAAAAWAAVADLPEATAAHTTKWSNGDVVHADTTGDGVGDENFYKATSAWNNVTTHSPTVNYDPTNAALKYVHTASGTENFYEAQAAWTNVTDYASSADVDGTFTAGKYVFHTGTSEFYKTSIDFTAILAPAQKTIYNDDGATGVRYVKDGSNFYEAKALWDNVSGYAEGNALTGITNGVYRQLTSDDSPGPGANERIYKSRMDLDAIESNAHVNTTNYSVGNVVKSGANYYEAQLVTADAATPTFATNVTSAQVEPMTAGQRILDTGTGVAYEATAALAGVQAYANSTRWLTGNVVSDSDDFWIADKDIAEADFTSGAGLSAVELGAIATNDVVLNSTQGVVYKALTNLGATASFNSGTAANAGDLLEDGGSYYKFANKFWGTFNDGDVITGGPAVASDLVFSGGTFWTAGGSSNLNNFKTSGADQWINTGHATLAALSATASASDETTDVTTPTSANTYWAVETDATTLANNDYWSPVNEIKQPATDAGNIYWNSVGDATDPTANQPGNAYWTDVTNEITLQDQDAAAGTNDYWEDVTASVVDFSGGLVGEAANFWDDVTNDVTITASLGANGTNDFWDRVHTGDTAEDLTDLTDTNWWTGVGSTLKEAPARADDTWWEDANSEVNNLSNTTWWTDITSAFTDTSDTSWWTEVGHADNAGSMDTNYWQLVTPEMNSLQGTGTGGIANSNSEDHTIWAEMGNLNAFAGSDGNFATHDADEDPYRSSSAPVWSNADTYTENDVVRGSDGNFYRFKSGGTSTVDPTSLLQGSWDLVIDAGTYASTRYGATTLATTAEEAALGFQYADTYMWRQDSSGVPIPGSGAGWANYWEELNESVIHSSQALGTVDLSEKLVNANFKVSLGGGLSSGLGNFFIGEGEGVVRIDYDINKDTVSNLIDRVNDSGANVHMYYDPVSDRFVIRNKEPGAVGIVLHESESYDTLNTINQGAGNMLFAMGLAAPVVSIYSGLGSSYDFAKYNTYNAATTYEAGDFVRVADGASFTYWQAMQDSPTDTPDISSAEWSQVVQGVGRTMNTELGENSKVKVNGGDFVYSLTSEFSENEHGYDGMYFDISGAAIGESASFTVAKDTSKAKAAIDNFVEEFNDAQDYVKSLVSVTNDGETVTSGRFSSNIEISRLGSQLRKVVFGNSTPHSESGTTSDGADLIINDNTGGAGGTALANIKTQLQLGTNNSGYVVKVLKDTSSDPSGEIKYYEFDGTNWAESDPAFSSFRLSNLGLDFGIGSDRMLVKNSALLLQALEDEPEKVQALFAEETVDNAFDLNSNSNRKYEGLSYALDDFISSFLSGDSGTGYKGAYNTHVESIKSQNKRIDERIEDYEKYIEQREKTLSEGFMRMEEMQSKLNTQLQTLQNSFKK